MNPVLFAKSLALNGVVKWKNGIPFVTPKPEDREVVNFKMKLQYPDKEIVERNGEITISERGDILVSFIFFCILIVILLVLRDAIFGTNTIIYIFQELFRLCNSYI